jgi:hypothetical protein
MRRFEPAVLQIKSIGTNNSDISEAFVSNCANFKNAPSNSAFRLEAFVIIMIAFLFICLVSAFAFHDHYKHLSLDYVAKET